MITPVLPTYDSAKVSFERGEGVRVFTPEGEAYLDFGAGIAVNALRPRPSRIWSKALTEQAQQALAHLQPLPDPGQEKLAQRLVDSDLRRHGVLHQFGRRGAGMRDQDGAQVSLRPTASPERFRIITFEGAFHGRTLATIAAGGQENISKASAPRSGFDQVPFGDHRGAEGGDQPRDGRHPDRADAGRRRHPPGAARVPARACATSATSTACC